MNLATRCLSCGTVFRVGQDQLLASDGWVRCGRCNGVFNAAEVLFDIDSGEPMHLALPAADAGGADHAEPAQGWQASADAAPTTGAAQPVPRSGPAAARQEPHFDATTGEAPAAYPDEPLLRAPSRQADDGADEPITITDHVPQPAAHSTPAAPATAPDETPATDGPAWQPGLAAGLAAGLSATGPGAQRAPPAAMQAAPSFLRTADRAATWRHPGMRLALAAGVLLLAAAALLQMALLWRDTLAAHLPRSTPALTALCQWAGCTVQPLRRIQQLSVQSSGLNRLEGAGVYRLQLVLHNRADTAVMLPALDLTLTDPQGQLLARRVLQSAELGLSQAALQAGQALPVQLLLGTGELRAAGYTLELFYP